MTLTIFLKLFLFDLIQTLECELVHHKLAKLRGRNSDQHFKKFIIKYSNFTFRIRDDRARRCMVFLQLIFDDFQPKYWNVFYTQNGLNPTGHVC